MRQGEKKYLSGPLWLYSLKVLYISKLPFFTYYTFEEKNWGIFFKKDMDKVWRLQHITSEFEVLDKTYY